jgi:ankyrin repeat protein
MIKRLIGAALLLAACYFGYRNIQIDQINMPYRVLGYIDEVGSTTPLHMAVVMSNVAEVERILDGKAQYKTKSDVHSTDGKGHNPLYYVAGYRPEFIKNLFGRPDLAIAKLLIAHGADVNAHKGEAIEGALNGWGNIDIVRLLLENGLNVTDKTFYTTSPEIEQLLIAHGAQGHR